MLNYYGINDFVRYIKFFKPFEVLSKFTDNEGRSTLRDFIPIDNVYPAGRLDYRSEGLLILTDNGRLIQQLTDPRYKHPKTYLAQVEGILTPEHIEYLRNIIVVPGLQTRLPQAAEQISKPDLPPRPKPVRDYHPTSWLKITLIEGKKHQVRRMTAAIDFPTLRLVRVAIGNITIENLVPGKWQYLSKSELQGLLP